MKSFTLGLAGIAILATQSYAVDPTLEDVSTGATAAAGGDEGADVICNPGGTAVAAGFAPADVVIDQFTYTAAATAQADVKTMRNLIIKWAGSAATDCVGASPDTALEAGKVTTLGTAGKLNWINDWKTELTSISSGDPWITGFTVGVQTLTDNTTWNANSKSLAILVSTTTRPGVVQSTVDKTPLGPIVQFKVKAKKYVDTIQYAYWADYCKDAKIIVTAGWTIAKADATADYAASGTKDLTKAETSLVKLPPGHNMDVFNWTACDYDFVCETADAAICSDTADADIKIKKAGVTALLGGTVKISAKIKTNTTGTKAVGTVTYLIHPKCDAITSITAPTAITATLAAGAAAKEEAQAFASNMTGWNAEACGETVAITGTAKDMLAWAAGKLTITVPKDTKAGEYLADVTYSKPTAGVGTDTSVSTATGVGKVTLTVTAADGAGGDAAGGDASDTMAMQAATLVGGILAGSMMAAAMLPSPTATTAGEK